MRDSRIRMSLDDVFDEQHRVTDHVRHTWVDSPLRRNVRRRGLAKPYKGTKRSVMAHCGSRLRPTAPHLPPVLSTEGVS